jgi:hypothetical protein
MNVSRAEPLSLGPRIEVKLGLGMKHGQDVIRK